MNFKHTLGAIALMAGLAPFAAANADYPERPIRMIVPFAAGGPADMVGREFAKLFGEKLGQPVVVVNAGGGHGVPALNQVLGAEADGYTLLMPASGNMTVPSKAMQGKKVLEVLAPISLLTESPHVLVVNAQLPVNSVPELVDYARAHPGKVNFGSAGVGGVAHLGMELFKSKAKVDVVHVPYRGTSQVLTDLASGQVQALFSSMPSLKPMIDKGSVKALAMSAPSKGADTAKLPLISQTLPGVSYTTWYALFAKAGTPPEVLAKLNAAVVDTLKNPELNQKFESQGVEFVSSTPQQLADTVRRDTSQWTALIDEAGIEIE
ncbi:Bug family tripartite tricarboxylate transporter substrate binding protein [Achromobacter mucicolens]|uniref:Bug family tripartite tricarboxylate transporter substrate binding protein n=1 Tax=Achromobacter mucicolens TaxID=1389922 RepID=UPI0022F3D42A|nr:tripartite tricarboxylate transporter substrate binding protein [Achromobacter mucicolens]WBX86848.1 tripartite tricarboxylate transporter substrate binding protein [Achromobacter mucicolens]